MTSTKHAILTWLSLHKSTTLPAWLNRNPEIRAEILAATSGTQTKNIMEDVYIFLNGPQPQCKFGNPRQFDTFDKGYKIGCILGNRCACVAAARKEKQAQTLMLRYGVSSVKDIPGIVEKRKSTIKERYGVEHAMHSAEVLEKFKRSLDQRTQEQIQKANQRRSRTMQERFGVAHHMKDPRQKQKVRDTNLQRYGCAAPLQNSEISAKMRETLKHKDYSQGNEARKNTFRERYGVDAASQIQLPAQTLEILKDRQLFIDSISGLTREQAQDALGIASHTLYLYAVRHQARSFFKRPLLSKFEEELAEFLDGLEIQYKNNDTTTIAPRELDFFIPSRSVAIECNGLYWHSEQSAGRTRQYHASKYQRCWKLGITLISIFEDEWNLQKDKVKARLAAMLNDRSERIYARQCEVKAITSEQSENFVNAYHLQNHTTAKFHLGLFFKGELVSVMTFDRARYNSKHQYEIIRFCSSKRIIGGASKLFAHFVQTHNPDSVVTYSDNRWGGGNVYDKMGFRFVSDTVGYYYTDYKQRFNRIQFQKHKLVKEGADPSLSEWQIMQQRGFDRIWDCGQKLWLWRKQ